MFRTVLYGKRRGVEGDRGQNIDKNTIRNICRYVPEL